MGESVTDILLHVFHLLAGLAGLCVLIRTVVRFELDAPDRARRRLRKRLDREHARDQAVRRRLFLSDANAQYHDWIRSFREGARSTRDDYFSADQCLMNAIGWASRR